MKYSSLKLTTTIWIIVISNFLYIKQVAIKNVVMTFPNKTLVGNFNERNPTSRSEQEQTTKSKFDFKHPLSPFDYVEIIFIVLDRETYRPIRNARVS